MQSRTKRKKEKKQDQKEKRSEAMKQIIMKGNTDRK